MLARGTQRFASRSRQRTNARRARRPAELTAKPELAGLCSAVLVSTTDEHSDSRVDQHRETRAGRAVQCRARFHDGRTLGQPSRPAEVTEKPGRSGRAVRCLQRRTSARTAPSVGRTRRKIRSTRVNATRNQLTGEAVRCTALYISQLLDQSLAGRPSPRDRFTVNASVRTMV